MRKNGSQTNSGLKKAGYHENENNNIGNTYKFDEAIQKKKIIEILQKNQDNFIEILVDKYSAYIIEHYKQAIWENYLNKITVDLKQKARSLKETPNFEINFDTILNNHTIEEKIHEYFCDYYKSNSEHNILPLLVQKDNMNIKKYILENFTSWLLIAENEIEKRSLYVQNCFVPFQFSKDDVYGKRPNLDNYDKNFF